MDPTISQALQFMLVGMSVVFGFLILMVLVMNLAARILKNFPEEDVVTKPGSRPRRSTEAGDEGEIALAIAITRSRQSK